MSEHTPGPCECLATVNVDMVEGRATGWEWRFCPLHAAAADLLAALETITDIEDGHDGTHPFACAACQRVDLARAAIAKARQEA